jgi:glyoxylate reductase
MTRILISTPMPAGCFEALAAHELIAGAPGSDADAEVLICAPTQPVDRAAQDAMGRLRLIAVAGTGSDAVDTLAAQERGIALITVGEVLAETTADVAFGLMIAARRRFSDGEARLRGGDWRGLGFLEHLTHNVHGATLGLVGFGAIGQAVARRAEGFSMRVLHHSRRPTGQPGWTAELDELLLTSDIVSLHVPLTAATQHLIDRRRLALLKADAVLVNTARGAIVDEAALADALHEGRLFAAGLDVYEHEPAVDPRLLSAPHTVLLPHIGSATEETRHAMLRAAAERTRDFLADAGNQARGA